MHYLDHIIKLIFTVVCRNVVIITQSKFKSKIIKSHLQPVEILYFTKGYQPIMGDVSLS